MTATTQSSQLKPFLLDRISEGGARTWDDTSDGIFAYESESMKKTRSVVSKATSRGTRSHFVDSTREGINVVGGSITFYPTKDDLDIWLPLILGEEESTDTFALGETLPWFALLVDKLGGVANEYFEYTDCKVNKATFQCTANEPLKLTVDILAKTENLGQAYPTLSALALADTAAAYQPWMFHDLALTLGGGSQKAYDCSIVIDNALEVKHASGDQDATSIQETDRIVTVAVTTPFTNTENTNFLQDDVEGTSGSAVFTRGTSPADALTFTFGALQMDALDTPGGGGRGEVTLPITFTARKPDAATAELVVTNADG